MSRPLVSHSMSKELVLSSAVLACLIVLLGAAGAAWLELGGDYPLRAAAAFSVAAGILWMLARRVNDGAGFNLANRITLLRVALVALAAAALGETPDDGLLWGVIALVTIALVLDGFDGMIARRTRTTSAFGARFDMETDAALIMILAVLCWQFGKAGAWILAAGGMRYGFVLAARFVSWLRAPLPASRRRQTVCILQSAGLLAVISPLVPVPASGLLALATLLMLGASFAVDIRWLWLGHRGMRAAGLARRS